MVLFDPLLLISQAQAYQRVETGFFDEDVARDERKKADYVKYPHLFVLCCLMDKQVSVHRAWDIPFAVCKALNKWTISELDSVSEDEFVNLFNKMSLHRFNNDMAKVFKKGVSRIAMVYGGDASLIWAGKPSSATVVFRFLEFEGSGRKIATMATNLLHRGLGIEYSDYSSIDISTDVHILRVMLRLGLLKKENGEKNKELAVYKAREIYPSYPGLIDGYFWHIGRRYCHSKSTNCNNCPIKSICQTSNIYNAE